MVYLSSIPLPRQWTQHVKSSFLQAVSLATTAFTATCALAANRRAELTRLKAELGRAYREIALLKEEMSIKDERFRRVPALRRPHYHPIQRLRVLQVKAARGWTIGQTADAFILNIQTVLSWTQRVDEEGERALIQLHEPVNRFPDFVRTIVRQLKAFFPGMGKAKIAQILARAGLHMGVTTVGRILKERSTEDMGEETFPDDGAEVVKTCVVTARYPGHLWHLDMTAISTSSGFWVPWFPFSMLQRWPFCWWVSVAIDHFSRRVVGFSVFRKKPSSMDITTFLGKAISKAGKAPRHIITDRDKSFDCKVFRNWCKRKDIRPRYGAVGNSGSIAVVERFIRTMKNECTRKILVPYRLDGIREELSYYVAWYNEYRPHTYLRGMTPKEVYETLVPANVKPRYEPRFRWPPEIRCSSPQAVVLGKPGAKFVLTVGFLENRPHLPVIELKRVA